MLPNPHSARSYIILGTFDLSNRKSCHHEDTIAINAGNLSFSFEYKDVVWCTGHFVFKMSANFPRLRYDDVYWGPLFCDDQRNKLSVQSGLFPHDVTRNITGIPLLKSPHYMKQLDQLFIHVFVYILVCVMYLCLFIY